METLQQQYGLPINGIWGSLERQIFDNARVRTLPPQSAEAMLPPDYTKAKAAKYSASVSTGFTQNLMPKSLSMPGAAIPDGLGGVIGMAGAGLFTAAVITRADSMRRERGGRGGNDVRFKERRTQGVISSVVNKLTGRGENSGADHYDNQGYYDQQMAMEGYFGNGHAMNAQQQARPAGSRGGASPAVQQHRGGWVDGDGGRSGKKWFSANQAEAPDSFDPFPGGYPIPPSSTYDSNYGGPAAHPPLRPGDRRRAQLEAEGIKTAPYQPPRSNVPPPPPPPTTPPPPNLQQQQRQQARGWPEGGDWAGDSMGPAKDYLISSKDINDARNRDGNGPVGMKGGGGGLRAAPASRTTASVPPYGGWEGAGDSWGAGSGPAAVPQYGSADHARALNLNNPPNLSGNRNGMNGNGGGAMAAMSKSPVAVMAPPAKEKPKGILRGISTGLSDGLSYLTGAPNSSVQLRQQSEFTARAQRERELMAQVAEAQKYAQMEQKKRQQLEAAYQATRNAMTQVEDARRGLKEKDALAQQMKDKIKELEKALNDRNVAAASGVFTNLDNASVNKNGGGGAALSDAEVVGLKDRMAALEAAVRSGGAATGGSETAAMAAMQILQDKVKMLEKAWGQNQESAHAAAAAIEKMDALAAQVHALQQLTSGEGYKSMVKDASGAELPPHVADRVAMLEANLKAAAMDAAAVPQLKKEVKELREALGAVTNGNSSPNGTNSKSAATANMNLQSVTDRVAKLEQSLSTPAEGPLSLDVLYAKVGAVEQGLAQTANGSAGLIAELQEKIKQLEGTNSNAGAVGGITKNAFAPPKPASTPAAAPKVPVKPPAFKPATTPKPTTDVPPVKLPPDFTPAFEVKSGVVKKMVAAPADLPPPAAPPEKVTPEPPAGEIFEEGTLPRIATGREVMLQGFNWESHKFDWYNLVKERVPQISKAGFTQVWLPPCTDSLAPEGYLPRNLGSLETKYGGEAELRGLIAEMRSNNVLPVLDAVLNHRCATHKGAGDKWNRWEGTGFDWGEWAITNRNADFAGQGGDPTGDEFWGSPNIDHREPRVQEDLCRWAQWMINDVGFGGIRFDFSKGYGGEFTGIYVRACNPEFAVGEYWDTLAYGQGLEYDQDAHRQRIVDWIDQTGGICTAFDFTTKGILQEACGRNEFWRLVDKKGRAPGVIGLWPGRAVTFIDNHDTGSTQSHWPFPSNKVGMGYAYTITHPGTPSIFWDHYFDWGDALRNQIQGLLDARKEAGIHSRSKLEIVAATDQVYAALVDDALAVKLGHDGWSPSGEGWNKAVDGDGWCVWIRK